MNELQNKKVIDLPFVPKYCQYNAHMFYIKVENILERNKIINFLRERDVYSVFHYIPLHSSDAGHKFSVFCGEDKFTTKESERLIRLPMYYGLKIENIEYICSKIGEYYER